MGFNRNIVECKAYFPAYVCYPSACFNRNIVECKLCRGCKRVYQAAWVLIETLWNVNVIPAENWQNRELVLIETLWNVNEEQRVMQQ